MDPRLIAITALVCLATVYAAPSKHEDPHHQELGAHLDKADTRNMKSMTDLFTAYVTKHQITFKDEAENTKAFNTFTENSHKIKQHRVEHGLGMHHFTMGLTHLSHLSFEEFKATRLGHVKRDKSGSGVARKRRATPPPSVDWTTKGYTTTPTDQGVCGCCWTFATAAGIEGAYFKKTGKLMAFSKQQLVECVPGFQGCDGGAAAAGVDYIQTLGGLAAETSYPYSAQNGAFGACKATPLVTMAASFQDLPAGDDLALMNALATYGPIPSTIAVGQQFMSYTGGIINPATACVTDVNHAITLVGYGTDTTTGQNFWKIKNSWGPTWGEKGFFRLSRGVTNSCGVSTEPIVVTVA